MGTNNKDAKMLVEHSAKYSKSLHKLEENY